MATRARFRLGSKDRKELRRRLRTQSTKSGEVLWARILLALDDGDPIKGIAERLHVSRPAVYAWKSRYLAEGLAGLADRSRPGRPTAPTEGRVERILFLTTQRIPHEATHWSTRLMAKYAGVSQWQLCKVWAAAELKPHRLKTFKISNDPRFAEKVVDVVGLYLQPPDNAMVLSVDEKTQIQALDRTQPQLPLRPGQIERRTHDYKCHGTASLYAGFDVATGKVMGRATHRHRAKEFLQFLKQIDHSTPRELDLHLILDDSSTHKTDEVRRFVEKHPRFIFHFTPTSASWLNTVETWFLQFDRRAIHRGVFTPVQELQEEIRRYIKAHNERSAKPFQWTKSAQVILDAVAKVRTAHV